jgi:ATP-binding cassette subfamily A (ABC1) protein 3
LSSAGAESNYLPKGGEITPTTGQILVNGASIVANTQSARLALGVCPQFTAIDAQLSVAEHLAVYGRLKGLRTGSELRTNVDAMLKATGLATYADREASRLSGGNQRKLALAIALMGECIGTTVRL